MLVKEGLKMEIVFGFTRANYLPSLGSEAGTMAIDYLMSCCWFQAAGDMNRLFSYPPSSKLWHFKYEFLIIGKYCPSAWKTTQV